MKIEIIDATFNVLIFGVLIPAIMFVIFFVLISGVIFIFGPIASSHGLNVMTYQQAIPRIVQMSCVPAFMSMLVGLTNLVGDFCKPKGNWHQKKGN